MPVPGSGQVLIKVAAAGVNRPELCCSLKKHAGVALAFQSRCIILYNPPFFEHPDIELKESPRDASNPGFLRRTKE